MKKQSIINLIKYHVDNNDPDFKAESYAIAKYFDEQGDNQIAEYIMALLSDVNAFVPQIYEHKFTFFKRISTNTGPLPLPNVIKDDLMGIVHAMNTCNEVNKFLFIGESGTGKTESARQIARITNRELYQMSFTAIIDSKLGQTAKNLSSAFNEINGMGHSDRVLILLDEIDAIALNRTDSNDIREMGRVTSTLLYEFDNANPDIVFIATTNLYKKLDKALARRFDATISFDRYSKEDLCEIAESILSDLSRKFKNVQNDSKLFKKILNTTEKLPNPGILKNLIKTSLAFNNPDKPYDYLSKLYRSLVDDDLSLTALKSRGYSLREIEKLTGVSKSQVSRSVNA